MVKTDKAREMSPIEQIWKELRKWASGMRSLLLWKMLDRLCDVIDSLSLEVVASLTVIGFTY